MRCTFEVQINLLDKRHFVFNPLWVRRVCFHYTVLCTKKSLILCKRFEGFFLNLSIYL